MIYEKVSTSYEDSIKYLESLAGFGMRPGLQRITKLLDLIGHPERKYKTIHVTGTNGKGSVCAILSKIIETAGAKVGMFTSPHLTSYCERIKINNVDISESDFAFLVEVMKDGINQMLENGDESPTLFETLTAMAFTHFALQRVEYAVIEVGLGGLLDSTNVIIPEVSVITNVAYDHADKCGGDLRGIAMHKAGIIKPGVPVVTAATGEALQIIVEAAENADSEIYSIDFENEGSVPPEMFSLQGAYQMKNFLIATIAINFLLDERMTPETMTDAMPKIKWPGRFEIFNVKGKQIVIDGAHNGAGAEALRTSLDMKFPDGRRTFLFGVLKDKDIDKMIYNLFRKEDFVIVTKPDSERAAAPEDVCLQIRSQSIDAIAVEDTEKAFEMFINADTDLLIASGSLYMIGKFRNWLLNFI